MEETKVDDMYMENLEEWIFEEEKIVTYKFLSRSLKIHVNVAKQMLFNFVERNKKKHPDIGVVFLVSGLVPSNKDDEASDPFDQKVLCVKQEDLKQTLKGFSSVLTQHIYSVQQNNNTVSVTSLFCADQNKNNQEMSVASIAGLNSIKHKNAKPREAVSVPTVIKKEIKAEPVVKKEPSKKTGGIQEAFTKATKKSSPEKKQPTKSSGSSSSGASKGKGGSGIAGMFARQTNSKPKPKSTEEKENIANQKIETDTSSGSKDSSPEKTEIVKANPKTSGSKKAKSSGKKSAKVDDGKKRKRIQVFSDSEEEEEDDKAEEVEEPVAEVEEEAPPVSKLIESDEEVEEEIAPTPVKETKARVGRRRVKKMVDKTYMDDAGYMVTKKEYVSGSETDEEPELKKPNKKVEKEKVEQPVAKKPKLTGSGTKGQTGIMNFFKKK